MNMLFNEKEMLDICEKYGIDVVEKDGYPLYNGEDLSPDFAISELMHESYKTIIQEKTIFAQSIEMKLSLNEDFCCYINMENCMFCSVKRDDSFENVTSSIEYDNENKKAA